MAKRKHITLKTKLAATLLRLGHVPYNDAKQMTEGQIISLYQFDHNIFHESGHPDRDLFWNLRPMLIHEHREKTRRDAHVIAKGRRIRAWNARKFSDAVADAPALRTGPGESKRHTGHGAHVAVAPRPARRTEQGLAGLGRAGLGEAGHGLAGSGKAWRGRVKRKIPSRPFDRRFKRKVSGEVTKR